MVDDAHLKTASDELSPTLPIKPSLRQAMNQYISDHLVQESVLQEKVAWLADKVRKILEPVHESVQALRHLDLEDYWNDIFIVLGFMMVAAVGAFVWYLISF